MAACCATPSRSTATIRYAAALLRGYAARLDEPLRVAIAGMVKAGKSTLLNAILGEEIAPTDTGECTRMVTWYRYGATPRGSRCTRSTASLASCRCAGSTAGSVSTSAGLPAEAVDRLVVDWPTASLRELTLIDTPGIASLSADVSARTTEFLTPDDAPSEADAIVYLMRHLHASDIHFLESFRDAVAGRSGTVNALAVLSRADEVGAGRIDSLISARDIADALPATTRRCASSPWRWSPSPGCSPRAPAPCASPSSPRCARWQRWTATSASGC